MKHSEAIKLLFHGWQRQAEALSPEASGLYMLAISGLSETDVTQAVRDFVGGRVEGHNRAFLPTSAELGDYVRKVRNRRIDEEVRNAPRPRLPHPSNTMTLAERQEFIARVVTPAINDMRRASAGPSPEEHMAAVRRTIAEAMSIDTAKLDAMIAALPDRKQKNQAA